MLQKDKQGSLGHAPQTPPEKHGAFAPMKTDPKISVQQGFRGLMKKGRYAMINHGIGRGQINRRGG